MAEDDVKKITESRPWLATFGQASVIATAAIVLNFSPAAVASAFRAIYAKALRSAS